MSFLTKTLPTTTTRTSSSLLRSQTSKQAPSLISRRNASSSIKSNPTKPTTTSKTSIPPPIWSTKLFALPKPRPLAKQRYESTAGVVESGMLVFGIAVVGTLYERANRVDDEEEMEGSNVESEEDHTVHEWIRPFDCYVVEEEAPAVVEGAKIDVNDE